MLISFVTLNDARKDPGEYWKSIMNGEPMPKAITDYFYQDPASQSNKEKEKHSDTINMDHFIKDFGTNPNLIIYHSHVDTQVVKQFAEGVKLDMTLSRNKSNLKHSKSMLIVP